MTNSVALGNLEINRAIIKHARTQLQEPQLSQLENLINQYYLRVSAQDLAAQDVQDLYGAALAHWHLARKRSAGEDLVRVYNPDFETHSWQSTHTVVEIIADDKPFLVDSVSIALNRLGYTIHLTIHPVIRLARNEGGELVDILDPETDTKRGTLESFMQFHINCQTDTDKQAEIKREVELVLKHVGAACHDWSAMREKAIQAAEAVEAKPKENEAAEVAEFCRWIEADHFTFVGYCEFDLNPKNNNLSFSAESALGVITLFDKDAQETQVLPSSDKNMGQYPKLLLITKANDRSKIHRPAHYDLILVKRFDEKGNQNGLRCIFGLFTSAAYNLNTLSIPLLRKKVQQVFDKSGLPKNGHGMKALQNIIDNYPRDMLFQIRSQELYEDTLGILQLQERQRVSCFIRSDRFRRFYSCLVYLPRERYNRDQRIKFQQILMTSLNGTSAEFDTLFTESVLARIQFLVHTEASHKPTKSYEEIEQSLIDATRSWSDDLRESMIELYGEARGDQLFLTFDAAFPVNYTHDFAARAAAHDIERIETARKSDQVGIHLYHSLTDKDNRAHIKLYSPREPISPSDALPVIENMGLRVLSERPYPVRIDEQKPIWVYEYYISARDGLLTDIDQIAQRFHTAFLNTWNGAAENDGFNQLTLSAGLDWREIAMLRAYCKYLRQIRVRFSESYMIQTLNGNPHMCNRLARLFNARFDPEMTNRDDEIVKINAEISEGLERVVNLDEDRILRAFLNVIEATIRTNFFQSDEAGKCKSYISFKLDPRKISRMPEPRPMFEIFVYSPRVEAVHLRGGRVARGGLRWSDRREDFRTEVLGLVKAQMVKNAVIVPMGSKGGFVVKQPPAGDRETLMKEVVACYKTFMGGMLDITDNIVNGEIVPPANVVRHDNDDPYLVVAADKGTATFSDIANSVSQEYGFWLGDAFASGGSDGYDHKGMGITARGAWESVKRNFRELGHDTQTQDFTVVGIGDMAGDVFGNGMLLSRHIKLVAAFNHLHIFLDPDPDPEASFKERERMFKLPRSSWEDYKTKLISKGGGIFQRSAKSITLTPEIQSMLDVTVEAMTPNELVNAILKAPVDLLWNGGIGTYVKAESESDDDAHDRANDPVRVNGNELRCRVIGEGGNLGMTQLGRIEYSRNGGQCYTDSIDNSAGVDTSDHEVNIKILLDSIIANGDMTSKQRNKLLADMTDEVGDLVLGNNYGQTQAVSIAAHLAPSLLQGHSRLMRQLEKEGKLQRSLEYLPDNEEIQNRLSTGTGLTKPELSILISYSKLALYEQLLDSDVPEDTLLRQELQSYFPDRLTARYHEEMNQHRLRREIITTHITNSLINRMGPTFVLRVAEISGASSQDITRAYTAAREIFGMHEIWRSIESLDNKIPAEVQTQMMVFTGGLIERASFWLLRQRKSPINIEDTVSYFRDGVEELIQQLPKTLAAENRTRLRRRTKKLTSDGVPADLANRIASFIPLSSALDIVEIADETKRDIKQVSEVLFDLGGRLHLMWMRDQVAALPAESHWHTLAKSSLRNDLHQQQRRLTTSVLSHSDSKKTKLLVSEWTQSHAASVERFQQRVADIRLTSDIDFALLSVALSEVQGVAKSV